MPGLCTGAARRPGSSAHLGFGLALGGGLADDDRLAAQLVQCLLQREVLGAAEERKKVEEQLAKARELKPLPEFGSTEDFPLQQALNQLRGKPVIVSKSATERKAEATETR